MPYYSVYGHPAPWGGFDTSLIELSPPAGMTQLAAGDFIEGLFEVILVPQKREDYFGSNEFLKDALSESPNSWQMVFREAKGNHLAVEVHDGTLEQTLPVKVRSNNGVRAEFTITGGVGYVPVTITGARDYAPFTLYIQTDEGYHPIDQSDQGNDWWQSQWDPQSGGWELSFSLPLDSSDSAINHRRLLWLSDRQSASHWQTF